MDNKIQSMIRKVSLELQDNYNSQGLFDVELGEKLPSRDIIISLINDLRKLTFPGYFGVENMAYSSKDSFAANNLSILYDKLFRQVKIAIAYGTDLKYEELNNRAEELSTKFVERIPHVQAMLLKDVDAQLAGDPAAKSKEEVIFSYPGLFAIAVYRYAHELYELQIPFIPRIMSEHAHSRTGIDINPGATIGEYFFIDHGTGIVIGETTTIGNHVKLYQGVTLGALSTRKGQALSGVKRHPTIEDNVVIYANTTVLGGETVVGANAVLAGNSFVTSSIPANSKAASTMPELEIRKSK